MKRYLFFVLIIFITALPVFSQDLLNSKDLSTIKIDQMTDADIMKYQQQLKSSGLSQEQAEQVALSRGFPSSELAKLKQRISLLSSSQASGTTNNNSSGRTDRSNTLLLNTTTPNATRNNGGVDQRIFGAELFGSSSLSFQPDLRIATPVNYELGPDDELLISVYGVQEASFNLTVSAEGTIYIPNVGLIKVAGETVEAATSRIKSRMTSIAYGSLRSGASKLSVTLGRIRSIRITVLGAIKPGTFTVSSLSTLFNILYLSGGPSNNGSFREIELIRGGKVEKKVDLYNFLLSGSQADNVRLRENDIIRIPIYKKRVEITGEVKRPGIFELVGNEKLNDVIRFASGFTDSAYRASIKVVQLTTKDKRVKDVSDADYATYIPNPSDYFEVSKILNRFQNRVNITGAVFRPGTFELTSGLTVSQLITKAEGLKEDAFKSRAQILRLKSDLTNEIITFNVSEILQGGRNDVLLIREDNVIITSIFDLKDQLNIAVQGEVRKPGTFNYLESITLKDVILQAGGFTEAAYPQRIEIARVIKRDTLTSSDVRLSEIIDVRSLDDLSYSGKNIALKPFDVITVRRLPGYLELQSVSALGQIQYPGPYVLSTRSERVSDLLKRAGGLTPEALADGAYLKRINEKDITSDIETAKVEKIQQQLKDTTGQITSIVARPFDQIPLDLNKIMANPGKGEDDLILKAGDQLYIPRNDEEIKISGEVLFPTQTPFNTNKSLREFIGDAGGFTDNAKKSKVYVLYPNGKAAKTSHFLFFKNYPTIKPGSEIVVPRDIPKVNHKNTAETLALASAVASIAGIVIALARLFQ